MTRRFRFGVNLFEVTTGRGWADRCRYAESLGYDVLLVPDHLGRLAALPSLVAAAHATTRPRLGTFVLNAGFHNPVLLGREVTTTDQLTDGRLEIGLGTGYVRSEFDEAGLEFESAGGRIDHLRRTVTELLRQFDDTSAAVRPRQSPRPPLLLGGNGERMLRLAARYADIVAFSGAEQAPGEPEGTLRLLDDERLAERAAFYRDLVRDRDPRPEMNIMAQRVVVTDKPAEALAELQPYAPHLSIDQLSRLPTLLVGTVEGIADQLRAHRERFGFTYISVLESSMEAMAQVMAELRRAGE